jgi:hypothetical protein
MTHENSTNPTKSAYISSLKEGESIPAMKLFIAEAVDPLSLFAFSTAWSTLRFVNSVVFSGKESDDLAISVT